ncbi:putative vacuolar ATP synthase subunit H [Gregarina niphandrodes]|uniref:Vacuolar ATP synthase subunit H n=1 Tax=Gregarina niphandrodes TaxID=110365 RepID=A0A023B3E2_GRENI|nr:putative vacuolar ATP synthase subunit H [Gregarina niphandrodes]EZG55426.1 putative vacuolar ATP synthase subunit H [Gregarina niphandrodes]|eukprot:XP_011131566.1 putative vacuolar ATP synthase subunit H [Gregarina niphandrodes]
MPADTEKMRLMGQEEGGSGTAVREAVPKPDFVNLARQGEIDQKYVDLLESAAAAASTQSDELLKDPAILEALLMSLRSINKTPQAAEYIASLIIDGCKLDTSNWSLVANCPAIAGVDGAYAAFSRSWPSNGKVVNDSFALLISTCLNYNPGTIDVRPLFKLIIDPSQEKMTSAGRLAAISSLLRLDALRADLCNSSTLRGVICQGLTSKDVYQTYYAVLCLWQLSFNRKVVEEKGPLYIHRSMLRSFLAMFGGIKKEKIVRASIMLLNNLVDEEWIFEILIQQKVDYTLTSLTYEKWRDEELSNDIESLQRKFYHSLNQINHFDRYLKELDACKFTPGPLHTEKFWIENVNRFEDNEYDAVKKLSNILFTCEEPQTLSLALFDLGEFARLYPTGKQIMSNIGAKAKIMEMMNYPQKDVAREALLTTQKLMLDNWKQLGGGAQEKHTAQEKH